MSELCAITCFFNPQGFNSRLRNYRIFRERLSVPLITVELSFSGLFELEAGDADKLIKVRGRDVMWHKERLLNLAIAALPNDCRKVAWLDCDIVFEDEDWAQKACRRLEDLQLIHLFSQHVDLDRDASPEDGRGGVRTSLVAEWKSGRQSFEDFVNLPGKKPGRPSTGLAWMVHRELLDRHGLYDAAILGLGDRIMFNAAAGFPDWGALNGCMNPAHKAHYFEWARPFQRDLEGAIGCSDLRIFHLWHGHVKDRRYMDRYAGFERFQFDPATDIALDDNGCWRWSSDKPEMHRYVRDYFQSRREDG